MKKRTLITGAGGYLGHRIAEKLLEATDERLVLWSRPGATASIAQAFRRYGDRVLLCSGDLADDEPFAQIEASSISTILHAAAVTRFDIDADTARRINVDGTRKLLAFAEGCTSLDTFAHVSSIYATGLSSGAIRETPADQPREFANEYERSKYHAEAVLLSGAPAFRRQIFRVATVLCDDDAGKVVQHNVVHRLLRLLHAGLLPIVPGYPTTPCYLITGELVAEACAVLLGRGEDRAIFHVAPAQASSCTMQELLDWSHESLCCDDGFRRRRVLKPLFADAPTFDYLARTASTFSADVGPMISVVRPFARQLFVHKEVHNDRLVAAWPGFRTAPMRELIHRTCEFLVRSAWTTEERR